MEAEERGCCPHYVLLLKSKKAGCEYEKEISRICRFNSVSIPVLDFAFEGSEHLLSYLQHIDSYGGLIFTSSKAVDAFAIALKSSNASEDVSLIKSLKEAKIFVVGEATKKALMKMNNELELDLRCDGSGKGSAEELSNYMKSLDVVCNESRPFLFVCGNIARDTIPRILMESNIKVKSVCVYETLPDSNLENNLAKIFAVLKDPKVIVFFSPSGIEFSLLVLKRLVSCFDEIKFVAIGKTTADCFTQHGYTVDGVSEKPTAQCLSMCIKNIIEQKDS